MPLSLNFGQLKKMHLIKEVNEIPATKYYVDNMCFINSNVQ